MEHGWKWRGHLRSFQVPRTLLSYLLDLHKDLWREKGGGSRDREKQRGIDFGRTKLAGGLDKPRVECESQRVKGSLMFLASATGWWRCHSLHPS